jgi:uncharacterized protein (DUF983 family)
MPPPRTTLLKRAFLGQCPRCRSRRIFNTRYRLHAFCPDCRLPLEHEDGWSLGAIPLNYALTCLFWVLPVGLLFAAGLLSLKFALVLAAVGAVLIPFLTYRHSKSLWVGLYYAVLPHEMELPPVKEKGVPVETGTPSKSGPLKPKQ